MDSLKNENDIHVEKLEKKDNEIIELKNENVKLIKKNYLSIKK